MGGTLTALVKASITVAGGPRGRDIFSLLVVLILTATLSVPVFLLLPYTKASMRT